MEDVRDLTVTMPMSEYNYFLRVKRAALGKFKTGAEDILWLIHQQGPFSEELAVRTRDQTVRELVGQLRRMHENMDKLEKELAEKTQIKRSWFDKLFKTAKERDNH